MATNKDVFCPTPYEDKLLAEMINPENFGINITELCRRPKYPGMSIMICVKKKGFGTSIES